VILPRTPHEASFGEICLIILITSRKSSDLLSGRFLRDTKNGNGASFIRGELCSMRNFCVHELLATIRRMGGPDKLDEFLKLCNVQPSFFFTIVRRSAAMEWVRKFARKYREIHDLRERFP